MKRNLSHHLKGSGRRMPGISWGGREDLRDFQQLARRDRIPQPAGISPQGARERRPPEPAQRTPPPYPHHAAKGTPLRGAGLAGKEWSGGEQRKEATTRQEKRARLQRIAEGLPVTLTACPPKAIYVNKI